MQCYPTPPSAGRVPHSQPRTEAAPGPPRAPRATQPAALPPRPATAAPPDRSPGLPPLPSAMLGPAPRLSREPPPAPPSRAERGVLARAALHLPLRPPPALGGSPRRFIAAAPPSGRERAEPRPRPARHGSDVALESGFHIHILTQYYSIVFNHVISSSLHHLAASEKLPCLLPRSTSWSKMESPHPCLHTARHCETRPISFLTARWQTNACNCTPLLSAEPLQLFGNDRLHKTEYTQDLRTHENAVQSHSSCGCPTSVLALLAHAVSLQSFSYLEVSHIASAIIQHHGRVPSITAWKGH